MKKIGLILIVALFYFSSNAQKSYIPGGEFGAGIRLGGSSGVSIKKHFNSNTFAIEGIIGRNFDDKVDGLWLSPLFEGLVAINASKKLSVITGGGPSFVFGDQSRSGLAGILGFDWRVGSKISTQLDWQPTWYFINGNTLGGFNLGFTVRYNLNR